MSLGNRVQNLLIPKLKISTTFIDIFNDFQVTSPPKATVFCMAFLPEKA